MHKHTHIYMQILKSVCPHVMLVYVKTLGVSRLVIVIIGAVALKGQVLYSSDPPLAVECSGTETDLSECIIDFENCSSYSYAGISCQPSESVLIVYIQVHLCMLLCDL